MFKFNPTLKNINDNLFSKELGFDEMRNVYRMRIIFGINYRFHKISIYNLLLGISKYQFFNTGSIQYTKNNKPNIINLCAGKTLIISSQNKIDFSVKNYIEKNKLYDMYIDNSKNKFILPNFNDVLYDTVIIYSTFANNIEVITTHYGLLNLYYFHINFLYVHKLFKILKLGGNLIMWFIPIHINACAELSEFLFSHFENVSSFEMNGRSYIFLKNFKGYDKYIWKTLMKYWYKLDPDYGVTYKHKKHNDIILKNLNIAPKEKSVIDYKHKFFDKVFEGNIDISLTKKISKHIIKYQIRRYKFYIKFQNDINYLCKKYYDSYKKFYKLCHKKNIKINPVLLKYDIRKLIDIRTLKQYLFKTKKYLIVYDLLHNLYNSNKDIEYIYNSLSANMNKYNICYYNLKKKDIQYIIPIFKIFNYIEINIYNKTPIKRFQRQFNIYASFNKVDKKYDIIVCRYNDYKDIENYAKTVIFLENINKYKPPIRYDTYKNLSYTVVGYLSSTKTKYQIYECFNDNSTYKKFTVLLKKILRFTDIDKLKPFIKSKSNDYIIYDFLYKQYKPSDRKSSGYMYSKYISDLVKDKKIETFMDFGAGSGVKTEAVKNILKLKDKNIYALDKKEFESVDNTKYEYSFNYIYYDGVSYPTFDIKFDLITCIQVLHHIFEIEHTIKYLKSILKKGGLLIIKEHKIDDNKNTSMLIDIEHSLYELGQNKNTKFLNTYYARYFTELEFLRLMTINGFIYVPIPEQVFDDNNPTNYIYYMFTV